MSLSFWVINGIGIDAAKIQDRFKTEKLVRFLSEQVPNDNDLKRMLESGDFSSFTLEDYLYGSWFDSVADILCHCDDTDTLTCASDGEGGEYFYYPPSMPWDHVPNEPQSEEDVIERIVAAVQKITDMSDDQIREIVDLDLYVVGCG